MLPGLVLNYFGQGAHALAHPEDIGNPFFALAPAGLARLALVLLSIAATIIASQALISGTFSLTRFLGRLVMHSNAASFFAAFLLAACGGPPSDLCGDLVVDLLYALVDPRVRLDS